MTSTSHEHAFVSLAPAGRGERRLAATVVGISLVFFLAAVPFAKVQLAAVWPFIPIYQSSLIVNDLITAVLLFSQFRFVRTRALLILASGYVFTAAMAACHMLTFPGLFAPTGLLGAGPQTTAWLFMFWHAGFPLFVLGYATLGDRITAPHRVPYRAIVVANVAVVLAAAAVTALATVGHRTLPAIMQGNQYTPILSVVVGSTWSFSLAAVLVLWRRRSHSVLDVWLMVVMCAWLFDIALAAMLNHGRFDLGFYAGRIYGLLAASFVLVVLLLEHTRLYARLAESNARLGEEVEVRRRAEAAAAEANRAKSEFLSRMSHELRTPLNGIMGFAQILGMELQSPEHRESLEHIHKGGRHLLGLINEVLDISRIEMGKIQISLEPVAVSDVVNTALDVIGPQTRARGLTLESTLAPGGHVMGDRQRLQQVLLNLLSNAIKYNRDGGRILVTSGRRDSRYWISVRDTGAGIAPAMLERLYTPFDRLGAERTNVEGTGLGLALSKRLTEAMRGTLEVESTVGEGTTFTVLLPPAAAPDEAGTLAAPASAAADGPGTARGVVLYIEDNGANIRLMERILERRSGLTLISATQGSDGLALAREHRPRVIVLDLHLPDMDGTEVLTRLRADARTREIPVVLLTADATPGQAGRLRALGATDYLTKPLDVQQFLALLDRVCDGSAIHA